MAQGQQLTVTVEEVDKQNGQILVTTEDGQSDWIKVVAPSDVKYARVGKTSITVNNGSVVFLKSLEPKTVNQSYSKPNNFSPFNKAVGQSQPFNKTTVVKKETDWDAIAWGKCKFSFLVEAYKLGKTLEVAEKEAEKWADASMRKLEITKVKTEVSPEVNALMEENLGEF